MSLLALALRIPAVVAAVELGIAEDATTAADLLGQIGLPLLALMALGFAPLVETVLLQWLPIAAVRRLGGSASLAWISSAALFAALHYQSGWAAVLVHVPTGLVLSWCYLAWRHRGLGRAILAPALVHFVLNALALAAAVSGGVV